MMYFYGDLFLYQNTVSAEKLLNTARVFSLILWSGLMAFFIWLFATGIAGPPAGALSVAVFSLMPVFISNNALVTTDAAPSVFYFGAFCLGYMFSALPGAATGAVGRKAANLSGNGRRHVYAALTGLLTGLAMASKFSMFIIPPLMIAFWTGHNLLDPKVRPARLLRYIAVYLLAVVITVACVYNFNIELYFSGLEGMFKMLDRGRSSFVWGHHYLSGVWWYFPLALGVKTPLAVLALSLAGLAALKSSFKKDYLWLILPPLIYFVLAMNAKVQIGGRHILPIMPFLAVLSGLGAVYAVKRKALLVLLVPLLALWVLGLVRTGPYSLAYFNELAGGPANGYKFLVDSNLDWGQDIKSLAAWLGRRGNPPVVLSYFGVARPEYYGMKYLPLGTSSNIELAGTGEDLCRADKVLLAVSATNLQSTYYSDQKTYDWLKSREPVFTAGYSIFLYDLTSDREGAVKLAELFDRNGMNTEAECLYSRIKK
jgi:4-amino-4-deoxy-L-arabinose transferase-like glycosyltransferase